MIPLIQGQTQNHDKNTFTMFTRTHKFNSQISHLKVHVKNDHLNEHIHIVHVKKKP